MADNSMTNNAQAPQDWQKTWGTPLFTASEMREVLSMLLDEKEDLTALLEGAWYMLPRDKSGEVADLSLSRLMQITQDKASDHSHFIWAITKIKQATGVDIRQG